MAEQDTGEAVREREGEAEGATYGEGEEEGGEKERGR